MTYEEFIEKELTDFGIDVIDELFSLGFEPVVVNGFWKWQDRINFSPMTSSNTTKTNVSMLISIT